MFKNYIFDWSGTVVDDLGPVVDATNSVYRAYQKQPLSREEFRREFHLPYSDFWKTILPEVRLEEVERLFRIGFNESKASVPMIPHARACIEAIAKSGARLFVLSSVDAPTFEKQLDEHGLREFFHTNYAGVVDKRTVIGEMIKSHGMKAEETCFIGDMAHDIDTARFAGVTSIGVATGYYDAERLVVSRPDMMFQDLSMLQAIVEKSSSKKSRSQRILIKGLEVTTSIGVPDEERATPQTLWLDLALDVDKPFGSMEDEIEATVDYHALSLEIEALARKGERKLIETLAEEVSDLVLRQPSVSGAEVKIRKKILPNTEYVGCEITRSDSSFTLNDKK